MSWEITLLYFFSWNFIWFGQTKPIKVQNFRLLTAHVKFHHICTLIGSFCRKYIDSQLKKVQRSYVSWHWRMMQNLEKNQFVVSKVTRIWRILIRALKVSKICTLISPFLAKYINFDLKKYRRVIWEIWRKTGLWFGKWHEELGKFSPEHLKV